MSETKTKKPAKGEFWVPASGKPCLCLDTNDDGRTVWRTSNGAFHLFGDDFYWKQWHHEPRCTGWDWVEPVEPPLPRYFVYVGTDVCFWDFVKVTAFGEKPMKYEDGTLQPYSRMVCRKDVEDWTKRGLWKEITEAESEALKVKEPVAAEVWPAVEPQPKQIKIFIPLRALSEPESDWPVRCSLTGIKDVASWVEIKGPFFGML